jgi:hypothetical protein
MSDFHQMTITSAQHTHTVKMCELMNERFCPKGSEGNGQAVLYAYAKSHLEGQGGEITIDEIATFIHDEYGFYEPPISYEEVNQRFVPGPEPQVFAPEEIAAMKIKQLKSEIIKWTTRTPVGKKAELVAELCKCCHGREGRQLISIRPYEMGGETIPKKCISLIVSRLKSNVAKHPPVWINSRGIHLSVAPTPVATPVLSPSLPVLSPEELKFFDERPADTFNRRSPSSGLRHSGVCDNPMNRQCVRCSHLFPCPTTYKGKNFHCRTCLPR